MKEKGQLQSNIRSLKETNRTLQAVNKELVNKLFRVSSGEGDGC